jgi:hypothetical protein
MVLEYPYGLDILYWNIPADWNILYWNIPTEWNILYLDNTDAEFRHYFLIHFGPFGGRGTQQQTTLGEGR